MYIITLLDYNVLHLSHTVLTVCDCSDQFFHYLYQKCDITNFPVAECVCGEILWNGNIMWSYFKTRQKDLRPQYASNKVLFGSPNSL